MTRGKSSRKNLVSRVQKELRLSQRSLNAYNKLLKKDLKYGDIQGSFIICERKQNEE